MALRYEKSRRAPELHQVGILAIAVVCGGGLAASSSACRASRCWEGAASTWSTVWSAAVRLIGLSVEVAAGLFAFDPVESTAPHKIRQ